MVRDRAVKHFHVVEELPDGFIPGYTVTKGAGVSRNALLSWVLAHRYTRRTQAVVVKPGSGRRTRYLAVSVTVAQRYENVRRLPRAPRPPAGWINRKKAAAYIGSYRYLLTALADGIISGVRTGHASYFGPPEGLQLARAYYLELSRPLPGWYRLRDLEAAAGVSQGSFDQWLYRYRRQLRRQGMSTREIDEYLSGHIRLFISPETRAKGRYCSGELKALWESRRARRRG